MAQVPYSPVPDVVPTAPAAPKIGVSTPPQAFGVTTAEAEQRLGGQAEQSGQELAATALYVKQLQNDTWAKNNFVDQSAKIGDREDYLYGLKGQEAVNAATGVRQQIQQIYKDAIANAPNPQAARMLGDQLSRRIAYSLVDIGRHTGQEQLRAAGDATASTMAVGLDLVSKNPWNDDQFNNYVKDGGIIDQGAADLERLGFGKATANAIKIKNQYWEARFEGLYRTPDQAQALLNQHEREIPPAAMKNIVQQIRSSESAIKFNATYGDAISKAQAENDISEISARNRIVTPDGQAGYKPEAIAQITDYIKKNPSADKIGQERLRWMRQANEDAAKGVIVQTKPEVLSALTANMFNYPNQTSERDLAKAENDRGISTKDREWVANTIKLRDGSDKETLNTPAFKNAMEWARNEIVNPNNLAAFQYELLTKYNQAVQDKALKPNDLDIRNEKGLFRQIANKYSQNLTTDLRATAPTAPPPIISTKAQYDALPPGSDFNDSRGRRFTKPTVEPARQPGE